MSSVNLVFLILLGFAKGEENIALGKPTWQSSTAREDLKASRAVDGNLEPRFLFCTHTIEEKDPWWVVDLKTEYQITRVLIYNRQEAVPERLHNFTIHVWKVFPLAHPWYKRLCYYYPGVHLGPLLNVSCLAPVSGRYLMVQIHDTEFLTLCEVQVMGFRVVYKEEHLCKKGNVPQVKLESEFLVRSAVECSVFRNLDPRYYSFDFRKHGPGLGSCAIKVRDLAATSASSADDFALC